MSKEIKDWENYDDYEGGFVKNQGAKRFSNPSKEHVKTPRRKTADEIVAQQQRNKEIAEKKAMVAGKTAKMTAEAKAKGMSLEELKDSKNSHSFKKGRR